MTIAIDDFPVKYSTFERICELEPEYVKIDRAYVNTFIS